jgi:hypothetical protein
MARSFPFPFDDARYQALVSLDKPSPWVHVWVTFVDPPRLPEDRAAVATVVESWSLVTMRWRQSTLVLDSPQLCRAERHIPTGGNRHVATWFRALTRHVLVPLHALRPLGRVSVT